MNIDKLHFLLWIKRIHLCFPYWLLFPNSSFIWQSNTNRTNKSILCLTDIIEDLLKIKTESKNSWLNIVYHWIPSYISHRKFCTQPLFTQPPTPHLTLHLFPNLLSSQGPEPPLTPVLAAAERNYTCLYTKQSPSKDDPFNFCYAEWFTISLSCPSYFPGTSFKHFTTA